jgi:hypothetical protein
VFVVCAVSWTAYIEADGGWPERKGVGGVWKDAARRAEGVHEGMGAGARTDGREGKDRNEVISAEEGGGHVWPGERGRGAA